MVADGSGDAGHDRCNLPAFPFQRIPQNQGRSPRLSCDVCRGLQRGQGPRGHDRSGVVKYRIPGPWCFRIGLVQAGAYRIGDIDLAPFQNFPRLGQGCIIRDGWARRDDGGVVAGNIGDQDRMDPGRIGGCREPPALDG